MKYVTFFYRLSFTSANSVVISNMLIICRKQVKIFRSVVALVLIDVMNCFSRIKKSSNYFFNNKSVFINIASSIFMRMSLLKKEPIPAVFPSSCCRLPVTFFAAKNSFSNVVLIFFKNLTTFVTRNTYSSFWIKMRLRNLPLHFFTPWFSFSSCPKNSEALVAAKIFWTLQAINRSVMDFFALKTWDILASKFIRTHDYQFIFVRLLQST